MAQQHQCECGNIDIITDTETGEQICTVCGTVLNELVLDRGPEWRVFNHETTEEVSRVGAPLTPLIHDKGLSTTISWRSQDATGKKLTQEQQQKQYRLRKWQRRTSTSDNIQRNLTHALSELTRIADELNLPKNTRETAAMIYRKAVTNSLIRGRTIQSMVASAIYMACRQCQVLRSLEEVAKAATITRKEAARNYRYLYKQLQPEVPRVDKDNLISKYVNILQVSGTTEQICRRIMDLATEEKLTIGRAPEGISAGSLYIACILNQEERTQGDIAKAAQITEVTIRNRYKELLKKLDFEVCL
jgi:transcription initiation factor TFIIB